MKILILAESFAPCWAFGGIPKVLFDIAHELVNRNHSVTVIATNVLDSKNEIKESYLVIKGVKIYYLKTLSKWLAWNQKIFLTFGFESLLKEKIEDSDVVVLASIRTIFSFISYRQLVAFNKPYVVLPYGGLPRGTDIKKVVKWILDPIFGYNTLRNASFVFAQTNHEIEEALKFGAKPPSAKLVPLNIDLSEFKTLPNRGSFRRKFGITSEERVILFLGRLHEYKGIELLIKSFSNLTKIKDNYRLVIVGRDDGYLSSMLKLIKKLGLEQKVVFTGPLYQKERINAYVDADVFVIPSSLYEETSTAALEACAASTPVIVTRQVSIPGLDEHNAGFTINYSQKELEDALLKILSNEKLRIEMGKNARKMVKETFSSTSVACRYEELFNNIIKNYPLSEE